MSFAWRMKALRRIFRRAPAPTQPFISVIIPAHNEEEFLPATLEALKKQTYAKFETIVVTNGCTDNTGEAVRGKCSRLFELDERGLGPIEPGPQGQSPIKEFF